MIFDAYLPRCSDMLARNKDEYSLSKKNELFKYIKNSIFNILE